MVFNPLTENADVLLNFPEQRDINYFENDAKLDEFLLNVKRFAFPYVKTANKSESSRPTNRYSIQNSSLVQFYTFVFTDTNRVRQYGFCRSAKNGTHIICMVSYLPWYNVFINILNQVSKIINDKEV